MKAVILYGGPRENGNTKIITDSFIKGLLDAKCSIDFIDITKLNINPCIGCLKCEKDGECFIEDDMKFIYEAVEKSDLVVLSSPVYFASVTSQLKTVIDRFQSFYSKKYVLKNDNNKKRKGYLIFTAGGKNEKMIESIGLTAKFFMLSIDASLNDKIYALGTDEIKVINREEILKKAYDKGFAAGRG
ncbi:NADPH-dependent FMN reductase [Caloramator quimbayensis]|uniref:NADPH-dependent FMN reductase n=1 Tax=Caloramator quimbayensis TaxID=1147123 RepID=A0A1T4XJ64_9CLOT|nr:flavodoxin family protein [Caloramator quimbayensis]SKA89453.1 NADPH-dependent FMN reductase [Caloramator quimbayensis]